MLCITWEFWTVFKLRTVTKVAVVIHNMMVEVRCEIYTSDGSAVRRFYIESNHTLNDTPSVPK